MDVDAQADLVSEIARLRGSIDRAAATTEIALAGHPPAPDDHDPGSSSAEHAELCRQLAALRERVALAERRNGDPYGLRAELATLWFFARTLHADADKWRSALDAHTEDRERRATAAHEQRERVAADREQLVQRRDALQFRILQTAARMAQEARGECRRTIPVFSLGDGLTVCSVAVSCPRRGFRLPTLWLVTLSGSQDVLVRRE